MKQCTQQLISVTKNPEFVRSLLANIVAWEQSLEVHRHEHQLSQEGHNPTPPFTEIHFSKTKNTLNNTQYTPSVMAVIFCLAPELAFHKLSAAVIFQIIICTKHCDWGTKKVRMRPPLEVKQSFCSRWEDYWQRQTHDCGKIGEIRKLAFALVTSKGHIYDCNNHYHSVFASQLCIILNMLFFGTRTEIPMQSAHKSPSF